MLRRVSTVVACLALIATAAWGQTVDELIAKNIEAKGGAEKIKNFKSARVHGRMIMGQGMEAPFTAYQKRPKYMRTEFTFQGMTGIQAFDGKHGWMLMPFSGKKEAEMMPAEQSEMAEEQADMDGPLIDYKEKGNKVELAGKEQIEGADAHKLKVTLKNGQVRTIYLDAESGLEVKTEVKRMFRGAEVESESFYSNYKQVEGMMMPFTVESGAKGNPARQKMVIDSLEVNMPMADTLFAMPAGIKSSAGAPDAAKAEAGDGAKAADSTKAAAPTGAAKKGKSAAKTKKP